MSNDVDEKLTAEMPAIERMVVHWYGTVEKIGRQLTAFSRVVFVTDSTVFLCLPSGGVTRAIPLTAVYMAYRVPGGVSQLFERGGPALVIRHESDESRDEFLGSCRAAKSIIAPGSWIDIHETSTFAFDSRDDAPVADARTSQRNSPDRFEAAAQQPFTLSSPQRSISAPDAARTANSGKQQAAPLLNPFEPLRFSSMANSSATLGAVEQQGGELHLPSSSARRVPSESPPRIPPAPASPRQASARMPNPIHRFSDPVSALGPLTPSSADAPEAADHLHPSLVLRDLMDHDSAAQRGADAGMVAGLAPTAATAQRPQAVFSDQPRGQSLTAPSSGIGSRPTRAESRTRSEPMTGSFDRDEEVVALRRGAAANTQPSATPPLRSDSLRTSPNQAGGRGGTRSGQLTPTVVSQQQPAGFTAAVPSATVAASDFEARRERRDRQLDDIRAAVGTDATVVSNLKRTIEQQQHLIEELRAASQEEHIQDLRAEVAHSQNLIADMQTALRTQESTFQEMLRSQEALRVSQSIQSSLDAQVRALTSERDALQKESSTLRSEVDRLNAAFDAAQRRHDRELMTVKDAFMQYDANVAEYIEELRIEHSQALEKAVMEERKRAAATIASQGNHSGWSAQQQQQQQQREGSSSVRGGHSDAHEGVPVPGAGVAPDALRDALMRHLNHYANARFQLPHDHPPPAPYNTPPFAGGNSYPGPPARPAVPSFHSTPTGAAMHSSVLSGHNAVRDRSIL